MTEIDVHEDIRNRLEDDFAGYVLITCKPPKKDGNMEVNMTYGGEPELAEYLLQGAQAYFDEEQEEEEKLTPKP